MDLPRGPVSQAGLRIFSARPGLSASRGLDPGDCGSLELLDWGYGAGMTLAGDGAIAACSLSAPRHGGVMSSTTSILGSAAAALALILCGCSGPDPSPSPSFGTAPAATDSLDFTMRSFIDQGAVAVVAQVRWPNGTWSRAYGVRDLETKQPVTPDDRVSVASVTKSLTAVSVLKLVDDGRIRLDDPVNGILDSFSTVLRPPGPITVRQLLAHTSGMPSFQEVTEKSVDDVPRIISEEITTQRGLELTAALPWEAKDVGSYHYSDSNYLALGQLLEKLRGKPYPQVLQDDVITPLGLETTSIDKAVGGEPDMIHGYITLRGERLDITQAPGELGSPAFGVISTMHDVNDFFAALFRGDLVSDTSLEEMTTPGGFPHYGLGIWKWSQGCTDDYRYGGRGSFWSYRTSAISSTDGQYQASMTLVTPPIPTPLEDPESEDKLDLWDDQMSSALQETLDRLCP